MEAKQEKPPLPVKGYRRREGSAGRPAGWGKNPKNKKEREKKGMRNIKNNNGREIQKKE